MNDNERDLVIKALGKSLDTEIKFITLAMTKSKPTNSKAKSVDKKIIICFGRSKIFILLESLESVKAEFEYSTIKKIVLDKNLRNYLRIYLDEVKYPKMRSFFLCLKDRGFFVKNLMCYYSIYYMSFFGEVKELLIKEKEGIMFDKATNVTKGLGVIHNTPEGYITRSFKKYE
jgi:hypothetical protein